MVDGVDKANEANETNKADKATEQIANQNQTKTKELRNSSLVG